MCIRDRRTVCLVCLAISTWSVWPWSHADPTREDRNSFHCPSPISSASASTLHLLAAHHCLRLPDELTISCLRAPECTRLRPISLLCKQGVVGSRSIISTIQVQLSGLMSIGPSLDTPLSLRLRDGQEMM